MNCDIILNFHGVGSPARLLETGEEDYWISSEFFEEIVDLVCTSMPRVRTGLTFDDGNASDLEICAPLLARQGLHALVFVLAGRLNVPGSLSGEDLHDLQDAGMVIGTHGFNHVNWCGLNVTEREQEFVEARSVLEEASGQEIRDVAIPFGSYDRKVLKNLCEAGYEAVYTSDGGPLTRYNFILPRTSVRRDMSIRDVEAILFGREPLARRLRRPLAMLKKRLL